MSQAVTRIGHGALFALVTLVLGAFAGAFTWVFFFLMNLGINFVWVTVPDAIESAGFPAIWYPIAFCMVGGIFIGLFQKRFGALPAEMNTVLAEVKATGRYEYDKMGISFLGALLPLLFGGSIGPEAGLTGVIAGLATWVGDKMRFLGSQIRELSSIGVAAVVSAIFTAPLFGMVAPLAGYADESDGEHPAHIDVPRAAKIAVYLLAIAGALGMMILLGSLFGNGGGLPHFSDINLGVNELLWGIPIALIGAAAGWLFHASGRGVHKISSLLGDRPVLKAVIAGAFLGACGILLPFTLFAGEIQTEQLSETWTTMAASILIATGFLKVVTTQACLGLGWRGGHFFPIIFAGIAIGYGMAALTGVDPVFALCACSAGLLGTVMRQPLMTALLLFLVFPVKAIFVLLIAAAIGAIIPVPKKWLEQANHDAK